MTTGERMGWPMAPDQSGVERFTRRWADALAGVCFVPMEAPEVLAFLRTLTGRLVDGLGGTAPAAAQAGFDVGRALVTAKYTNPLAASRTLTSLSRWLLEDLGETSRDRLADLLGGLAVGYAATLRTGVLVEQEEIRRAALTALNEAEHRGRRVEARFRAVFASATIGIGVVDTAGRVLDVNPAFAAMLGHPPHWIRGRPVTEVIKPAGAGPAPALEQFALLLGGERDQFRVETEHRRPDGRLMRIDLSMSLVREDGQPRYGVGVAADVTDQRRLQAQLWHEARHDALTGLPNRTLFLERLDQICATPAANARTGLCYLDLDGFKAVNDSLGHQFGDRLLVAVADRLKAAIEGTDGMVARLGGDEFAILVPGSTGEQQVIGYAEAALDALSVPFNLDGHDLRVSASVGVVERSLIGVDPAEVMRAADLTLYRAKAAGRRRWTLHDPHHDEVEITRHTLTTALPGAIERGEFVCEYQPMVDLKDGSLHAVEALVRWDHPRLGRLWPDRFIPLAEDSGLITALGRWVLHDACQRAVRWQGVQRPPLVSVNLAVAHAHDPRLVDDVAAVLAATGLPPGRLQLELTESAVLGQEDGPVDALRALADMGVRLAIDDFGTGYSNLAYLPRLPVHELKIAGALVDGLTGSGPHGTIVAWVIGLAHALGLTVTAEGVETEAQAAHLRRLGCDTAQGWRYAKAGPPEQIDAVLAMDASRQRSWTTH